MTEQERKVMEMALEWMEVTHHTAMTTYSDDNYEKHCKVEKELRQALAQDHGFDRTASHMAGEYVDTNWDTSDMAYRPNGLSVEQAEKEAILQEISDIGQKAHTDHPARHWDRTCPACVAEEQEPVARKYSIEPHGNGYAIYYGRTLYHHGANIGHLTEVTPATIKLIEDALNASPSPQAEKQEPVAWMSPNKECLEFSRKDTVYGSHTIPLYTAPPRKEWVGLTDEEIVTTLFECQDDGIHHYTRTIEARLKEKNT